ncbi:MAG TPA: asparagine synthase-related protein [Candidatus Acidoferrum sp.]|nr:asparagine synthase-related protein [Candidatus Acidoferrum sp.]
MSGIVGIYHLNDAPIERKLLQSLVDFLAYRGPDSRECWAENSIGLGHAMFRTTRESLGERQPASLEGRFWIVADARLDGREQLIGKLQRAGRVVRGNAPDSELILHAYAEWGAACVAHLQGDFSFSVWDARNKQLFCARDHFGIKPFYYAQREDLFVFSNTLNCVRLHPQISAELNDAAIGDFLLFGLNYDNATTTFRDIRRIPPAHTLTISRNGLQIRRYWTPPTDGRIRYKDPAEYVEHFQTILETAVADRLRTEHVGILLSGGLDSSSVAAVAKELSMKSVGATKIRGYTYVYESLIPDREGDFARQVVEFLGIPSRRLPMDEVELFEGWDRPDWSWPEPIDDPFLVKYFESCRIISSECRVLLSGEGPDNLMDFQMWPYVNDMRRRGEWQRLLTEIANYLWVRPFPWRGIRARLLKLAGQDPEYRAFPAWLEADFAKRSDLRARWRELGVHSNLTLQHPIHPRGHASLSLPQWSYMFELENAGVIREPLEVRYPFLDLRIVNYLLALPPFPWFFHKMLLREAMASRIPEQIRMRPKTPLQGDPVSAQLKISGVKRLANIHWSKYSDRFIEPAAIVAPHVKMNPEEVSSSLRPYCLNIWLQSAMGVRYNLQAEASNG